MPPNSNSTWWPDARLNARPIQTVRSCGQSLRPPALSHIVNFPRLELPLSGCYENKIESAGRIETVKIKPGTALFIAPNCWNLPTWNQKVELLSLLIGARQIGISMVKTQGSRIKRVESKKLSPSRPLTGPLPHIVEAMLSAHANGDSARILPELAQALIKCVGDLLKAPAPHIEGGRVQTLFESVCIFLQNNYQYDISRESVARQFNISPTHLSRIFHTKGHMTFRTYLTHVRVERAKYLLQSYNFKLEEIAGRCGYNHTTHFCEMFKQVTKLTPSEYRIKTLAKRTQATSTVATGV